VVSEECKFTVFVYPRSKMVDNVVSGYLNIDLKKEKNNVIRIFNVG